DGQPVSPTPAGTLPGLYSLGHRNPQGAALDAGGQLWVTEHGAEGGDELNRVERGRNYGWPVIAYGQHYGGGKIGIGTANPGMEQPVLYWDPSIAPSGLMIHSGAMFPEWRGDFFTGSLKFNYIARLDPEANYAEERIAAPQTGRVRDVREGPDGAIWFLSVHEGAVFRLARTP
ncbi:MAG TPA: PQQ-dependent sugar dehydrogenase, partial [Paracoccaceae bacterium]